MYLSQKRIPLLPADWSEEMEDRADNVYDDTKKKSAGNKKSKEKKLKEIDEVVKEDLE